MAVGMTQMVEHMPSKYEATVLQYYKKRKIQKGRKKEMEEKGDQRSPYSISVACHCNH
jgi:hypothetical protein